VGETSQRCGGREKKFSVQLSITFAITVKFLRFTMSISDTFTEAHTYDYIKYCLVLYM